MKQQMDSNSSLEQFGYKQELKRGLTLCPLIFLGLAIVNIIGGYTMYGISTVNTHGMFALLYAIATVVMVFTAISYSKMCKAFPIAGSAYSYVQRAINPHLGFMVGWAMIIDYMVLPLLNYVLVSMYLYLLIPAIPYKVWIVVTVLAMTGINIIGVKVASRVDAVITILGVSFVFVFMIFMVRWLLGGNGAGTTADISGIINIPALSSGAVSFGTVFQQCTLICLCFLGFDALTTYTEETVDPEKTVGKAIIFTCLIYGIICVAMGYLSQLSWPNAWMEITDQGTAAAELVKHVMGNGGSIIFSVIYLTAAFASGTTAEGSAARLLFVMGRDKTIPGWFSKVNSRFQTPVNAISVIALLGIFALFTDFASISSVISFGALTAFVFVNISVITHYYIKGGNRKGFRNKFNYIIMPIIGAALCAFMWFSLDKAALIIGLSWCAIGFVYLVVQTKGFKKQPGVIGEI
ncbi:MAG: APC family permease [Eubacteriaceae bacterium]|nr:APC family permease [Eubacteriaceae bacterium]